MEVVDGEWVFGCRRTVKLAVLMQREILSLSRKVTKNQTSEEERRKTHETMCM